VDDTGRSYLEGKGISFADYRNSGDLKLYLNESRFWDIVIVDMYPPKKNLLDALKNHCKVLFCFDDMGLLGETDIPGVVLRPQETFRQKIERRGKTVVVWGSDYFPLRPDLKKSRSSKRFAPQVKNVALVLGGAPEEASIQTMVRLLDDSLDKGIGIHVVTGFTDHRGKRPSFSSRIHLKNSLDSMGPFIQEMDLGIVAGGFIKYEFMCVGTPFGFVPLCSHQEKMARKFSREGYGIRLGHIHECLNASEKVKKKLLSFIAADGERRSMFERSRRLVDGQGSSRIFQRAKNLFERINTD
jgi:spore coat polysaccharide biosynthesis predicted glycosyltransferase SpsG